jgi:hypothetical protein
MMKRLTLWIGLIAILLTGVLIVSAQESIQPGDSVEGQLSSTSSSNAYTFSGTAGQGVVITLISSEFDAFLVLQDSTGNTVAEDDDSAGRLNARITATLAADDEYTVLATSLRAYRSNGQFTASGAYTLSLEFTDVSDVVPATPVPVNPTPVPAEQTPVPTALPPVENPEFISIGDIVQGQVNGTPLEFAFFANADTSVTLSLESDDFDPYLILQDNNDNILTANDDGLGNLNSLIADFTLPYTGDYVIIVTSYHMVAGLSDSAGAFTLTTSAGSTASSPPATQEPEQPYPDGYPPLIDGENLFEGRLSERFTSWDYSFEMSADLPLIFTLESSDFDPYLELLDANGELVAYDDDSGGGLNSRIGPLVLPESGVYTIRANSYGNARGGTAGVGAYLLTIFPITLEAIAPDESVTAGLETPQNHHAYQLNAETGDVLIINLATDNPEIYVELSDGTGNLRRLYGGANSDIGPFIVEADTNYLLTITTYYAYSSEASLDYTLTITEIESQAIAYDTQVIDSFDDAPINVYTFEATAGDIINVLVDSLGLVDTTLSLTDPNGLEIAYDDDSGAGFDPELRNLILAESGTYTLTIRPHIAGDNAEYRFIVENEGVRSLDNAPQIIRISGKTYTDTLTFSATAGETVRVSVQTLVSDSAYVPSLVIRQGNTQITENTVGTGARLILEFVVPEDGKVQIEVANYYSTEFILELTLERISAGE